MTPRVSIVVPCYNEVRTIEKLLDALSYQTFPSNHFELVIADAMSDDGTREVIQRFSEEHRDLKIRLVDNPQQTIPAALNTAIDTSNGEILVRLDAHSVPDQEYIARSVSALERTGAANVGGMWDIQPATDSWISRSIAAAASHPFSAGDARYRIGGLAGEVDTVPFGAFPREWLERVGPFNENLLSNEDYEYNTRLRKAGGIIWFDPSIRSTYFARTDFASLIRQYARYGFWKAQMLRLFPGTIRWRQAGPPLFVLGLISLVFAGIVQPLAWILLLLISAIYCTVLLMVGLAEAISRRDAVLVVGVALSLMIMQLSWGGAFLWGMIRPRINKEVSDG